MPCREDQARQRPRRYRPHLADVGRGTDITGGYIIKKDRLDPATRAFRRPEPQPVLRLSEGTPGAESAAQQVISAAQKTYLTTFLTNSRTSSTARTSRIPTRLSRVHRHRFLHRPPHPGRDHQKHRWLPPEHLHVQGSRGKLNMAPSGTTTWCWATRTTWMGGCRKAGTTPVRRDRLPWYPRSFRIPRSRGATRNDGSSCAKALSPGTLLASVDDNVELLRESQARNFKRWPVLGTYVWPTGTSRRHGTRNHLDENWIRDRVAWMDLQLFDAPRFNQDGGRVEPGFQLTITRHGRYLLHR